MSKQNVSTDFEVAKSLGALYTGGHVEWLDDYIYTTAEGGVNIVQNGSVVHRVEEEEDPVMMFTVGKEGHKITLISAHKSGLLRQYTVDELAKPEIVKTFRSIHTGPISLMKTHVLAGGGMILGTGGADGTLKIWDLTHQYYTHNFRTGGGVCTTIEFHPSKLVVSAGFNSGGLYIWDLTNSKQIHQLQGHYSTVTGTKFMVERQEFISAGRDKVVIIWDLEKGTKKRSIPVLQSVEGLYCLPESLKVVIAAEDLLTLWDLEVPKQEKKVTVGSEITQMEAQNGRIFCSTIDQNLVELDPSDLSLKNTVVGNNDEILDMSIVGDSSSHLVVACNSVFLRVYKMADYSCNLAKGHSDNVMCVSTSLLDKDVVCTGGKDREIRIWRLEGDVLQCLVVGTGHTEAVQGIIFLNQSINDLISVSKDTTMKMWKVDYDAAQMSSVRTEIAHEKEINCCDISPGDEMVATGSQDKTGKLWSRDLTLMLTLRGHRRGIWCTRFSPKDRLLATGSADAIIKLWNLAEGTCVKQLEGHDCSVLSLNWVSDYQIVSSGTDGLIKVWWVTKEECVGTLDKHEDKVWSVIARRVDGEIKLTSGSADGQLIFWDDITEAETLKKQDEADKIVIGQQKLANLLASKQYGPALILALRLSQPFTALKILKKLNYTEMEEAVLCLDNAEVDQLLGYAVRWNSNSKHCEAAQSVLHIILTNFLPEDLLKLSGCKDWVEGLLPYTEKHFERLSRLQMKSKFLSYMVANMKTTGRPQAESEL